MGVYMRYSADALKVQEILNKQDFYKGALDGLWGQKSLQAMDDYCIANGYLHIKIIRVFSDRVSTSGRLFLNGKYECDTLEDPYQRRKIYGRTRIPEGVYRTQFRTIGGFHSRYKKRFSFHRGMIHLLKVPRFKYIYIHIGNKVKDTKGCILVGIKPPNRNDVVWYSTTAYKKLYQKVLRFFSKPIYVSIRDLDR